MPTPFVKGRGLAVAPRHLHGFVAHELAVAIIGGRYAPGDVLPTEEQFSASLSVSRTAYREAIRILVAKGLVLTRPKTGTRIALRSSWNLLDPDVLGWHLEVEPRPDFVVSLLELRGIVEPAAAGLAAARRTAEQLAVLKKNMTAMEQADSTNPNALEADVAFHHAVLQATCNEPLIAMSDAIATTLRWTGRLTLGSHPKAYQAALSDHRAVVDAVAQRDPAAAKRSMARLIEIAQRDTLHALRLS